MADQKTEDPKSPLARRGARPFAGPAGAPSAARPFLRPVTTQRATAAPFLPPVIPGRPSLGAAPQPASAPTPVTSVPVTQAAPIAPIAPVTPPTLAPAPDATPEPDSIFFPQDSFEHDAFEHDAFEHDPFGPDAHAPDALANDSLMPEVEAMPSTSRPITSEMVALDAFDSVWGDPPPRDPALDVAATPSSLDEEPLGTGVDARQPWTDDITAGAETAAEMPAPAESSYPTPPMAMPGWLEDDVAAAPSMPAGPAASDRSALPAEQRESEQSSVSSAQVDDVAQLPWAPAEADANYSITEWLDAVDLPTADDVTPPAHEPVDAVGSLGSAFDAPAEWSDAADPYVAEARPRFELVEESETVEATARSTRDLRDGRDVRVAAALDRLAQRVRGGEIDVSFIAPDAPDAAILASVLAALLGGSSSR